MSPISTRPRLRSFIDSLKNYYYTIEKRAFTPNHLSVDRLKQNFDGKNVQILIMKPYNLNGEQINPDPESGSLHSKHIVHFVIFSVKKQEGICRTVSNHRASFGSWSHLHAEMKQIKTSPATPNHLHLWLSSISALMFPYSCLVFPSTLHCR